MNPNLTTFEGTNISHLGKKENHLHKCLVMGYVDFQEGNMSQTGWFNYHDGAFSQPQMGKTTSAVGSFP